jgi:uncharacterized OsmC-like protein
LEWEGAETYQFIQMSEAWNKEANDNRSAQTGKEEEVHNPAELFGIRFGWGPSEP